MCSGGSSGLHFGLLAGMHVWGTDDLKEGVLYSILDLSFLLDKDNFFFAPCLRGTSL